MTAIELKDDQLTQIIAHSIITGLSEQVRQDLIAKALQNLLDKPGPNARYGTPSHLQQLFNDAVIQVASRLVREQLESDHEFNENVQRLLAEVARKFFDEKQRAELVDTLVSSLHSALNPSRY